MMFSLAKKTLWRLPLVVAGGYLLFGAGWILISDKLLTAQAPTFAHLTLWQTYKGLTFVGLSTLVIFGLLAYETRRRWAQERELELTRYAMEHSFDEIYRISADGTILDANQTACHALDYPREILLGMQVHQINPCVDAGEVQGLWRQLQEQGSLAFETRHQRRDGRTYPVEVGLRYLVYEGEEMRVAVSRDISGRKRAEEALARTNQALRALSRGNSALIQAEDEAGLFEGVCKALTRQGGYPVAWVALAGDGLALGAIAATADGQPPPVEGLPWPVVRAALTSAKAQWGEAGGQMRAVALPFQAGEAVDGALVIHAQGAEAFDRDSMDLLEELAADLGFGLHTLRLRKEREEHLAELRLAATVFENSGEGLLVTDPNERILSVNDAFTEITGYTPEEVVGKTPALLQSGLHGTNFYRRMWQELKAFGVWQGEVWNRRKNGAVYPERLTLSEVRDDQGVLTQYVGVFADASRAHEDAEALRLRTYYDPVTNLPNRALFREQLAHALPSVKRAHRHLAVVQVDLEGFGALNDTLGSEMADEVLRAIGGRLQNLLRPDDTVARPAGDEFWLLLEDLDAPASVESLVDRIRATVAEPLEIGGETLRLAATIGVAVAPRDATDAEALIDKANTALHRAKREEHGAVRFFQPDMQEVARHRMRIEEALKGGLERQELEVWYQPQVTPANGAAVAVEALVRWRHPEWGLVSPGEFIPVAEETGLVVPLGEYVLERALSQYREWQDQGLPLKRVSVNVAAVQLQQADWPQRVQAALERTGVPAECLELEITEQSFLADLSWAKAHLGNLAKMGVRLAIDDFGTGYSSLAYLKELPLDTLKIDKAFIDGVPDISHDWSIVEAILGMAEGLGLEVVAEGTETPEQVAWLVERGVSLAQGFYFARPSLPEDIASYINQGRGLEG